jgi:glycosyltransferase involved in cell wall biosynthesis
MKVTVLMSTFNGAKFLDLQIQSILSQEFINFNLIIRDDASTDESLTILRKWKGIDDRISLIEGGENIGAALSFTELVKLTDADVIFFSDQDDIWLEEKISNGLSFFSRQNNEVPVLYMQNGCGFSKESGFINRSIQIAKPKKIEEFLFLNGGLYGCCMVFNRKMKDAYLRSLPSEIFMHDHHMTMTALAFGRIEYSDIKNLFYRKHLNNVSGGPVSSFNKATNFLLSNTPIVKPESYGAINSFFLKNEKFISKSNALVFAKFLEFNSLGFFTKVFYIFRYDFRIYKSKFILVYKLIFR